MVPWYDLFRIMKELVEPKLPEVFTFEAVQKYKEELRRYDKARIAAGHVTAEQVNEENSFFPKAIRIVHNSELDCES